MPTLRRQKDMETKKLYIKVPDRMFGKVLPDGLVMGHKAFDNTIRHIARLFTDKPVEIKLADAKILMEKDDRVQEWTASVAKHVKRLTNGLEKAEKKKKPGINRGPLPQPGVARKPSREEEGGTDNRGEQLTEDEVTDQMFNHSADAEPVGNPINPDVDPFSSQEDVKEVKVPGDEPPPAQPKNEKKDKK